MECGHAGQRELAEGAGNSLDLLVGDLGVGVRCKGDDSAMHLEQMPAEFVRGGLKVVLSVVGTSRRRNGVGGSHRGFSDKPSKEPAGNPHEDTRMRGGQDVGPGKSGMARKNGAGSLRRIFRARFTRRFAAGRTERSTRALTWRFGAMAAKMAVKGSETLRLRRSSNWG